MRGSLSQLTRRVLASVGGSHSAGLLPTTTQLRSFNMVPMVLERSQGGERAFDLYSRLLKEGIVFVNGPVNDQMSSLIVAQLLFLESEGTKKPVRKTHTHIQLQTQACFRKKFVSNSFIEFLLVFFRLLDFCR